MSLAQKRRNQHLWRTGGPAMAGLLLLYFAFPIRQTGSTVQLALLVLATAVGIVVVGYVIYRYVVESVHGSRDVMTLTSLLIIVELVIVVFSFGYYILGTETTGQMDGVDTRIDSLYFTLTTLGTVGFGDIHATGQFARVVVSVQIVFNLVFVGALVAVTRAHIAEKRTRPPSATREDSDIE